MHLDAIPGTDVAGWQYDDAEPDQAHLHDGLKRIPAASELEIHGGGEKQQGIITQMPDLRADMS